MTLKQNVDYRFNQFLEKPSNQRLDALIEFLKKYQDYLNHHSTDNLDEELSKLKLVG